MDDEESKRIILARRARFVAKALASVGLVGAACGGQAQDTPGGVAGAPQPCLGMTASGAAGIYNTGGVSQSGATTGGSAGGSGAPQPCLSPPYIGGSGGAPQPCLGAPLGGAAPEPCLSAPEVLGGSAGAEPCLSGAGGDAGFGGAEDAGEGGAAGSAPDGAGGTLVGIGGAPQPCLSIIMELPLGGVGGEDDTGSSGEGGR